MTLLDAGHVYSPHWRAKDGSQWKAKAGSCCAAVHEGGWGIGFYQCTRKAKHAREVLHHGKPVTLEYCGVHDPEYVKRKADKWRANYDAKRSEEQVARNAKEADRALKEAALEAVRKIAAGHNDPRTLALEVLGR